MSNKNFNVGQSAVCVVGSNKGKVFTIEKVLNKSYSCRPQGEEGGKYYEFNDRNLSSIEDWDNQDEIVDREMSIEYTIEEVIESIEKVNPVKVEVNLHMHFDKDEEFDYRGEHGVSVKVYESPREAKSHADVHEDIYHCSVEKCRAVQSEVVEAIKNKFPSLKIEVNEYTHK